MRRSEIGFVVMAAVLSLAGTARAQCPKRSFSDNEVLSLTSFGPTPGSQLWCGNMFKIPRTGKPRPETADLNCGLPCCGSAKTNDGRNVPAIERAEVRGWLTGVSEPSIEEGEVHFFLIPDFGWSPRASGVRAINDLATYMKLITPMAEGAFGAIRVELNYWEPGRICGVERGWCGAPCADGKQSTAIRIYRERANFCEDFRKLRPADWCHPTSVEHISAPFDPKDPPHASTTPAGPFQAGDYVRMVGTIWEDDDHSLGGCWTLPSGHSAHRGWLEMHSVDFMARLPAPAGRERPNSNAVGATQIAMLGACVASSASGGVATQKVDVFPLRPKPPGHWRPKVTERVSADFTNPGSVTKSITVQPDHATVTVTVNSPPGWGGRGLFFAGYSADWESCRASCTNKCGGTYDLCDGVCSGPCSAGKTCEAGRCVMAQCPGGAERCKGRCCSSSQHCTIRGCEANPNDR